MISCVSPLLPVRFEGRQNSGKLQKRPYTVTDFLPPKEERTLKHHLLKPLTWPTPLTWLTKLALNHPAVAVLLFPADLLAEALADPTIVGLIPLDAAEINAHGLLILKGHSEGFSKHRLRLMGTVAAAHAGVTAIPGANLLLWFNSAAIPLNSLLFIQGKKKVEKNKLREQPKGLDKYS